VTKASLVALIDLPEEKQRRKLNLPFANNDRVSCIHLSLSESVSTDLKFFIG
jgi:hypothetical protein